MTLTIDIRPNYGVFKGFEYRIDGSNGFNWLSGPFDRQEQALRDACETIILEVGRALVTGER
jgi:hypothetical protein